MNNDEIEKKIKQYKKQIRDFELEIAKDEERLKSQNEAKSVIMAEIENLIPGFDPKNLEQDIILMESQLEADMRLLEMELDNVRKQIEENK